MSIQRAIPATPAPIAAIFGTTPPAAADLGTVVVAAAALARYGLGWYWAGLVELVVPFQQYWLKQAVHAAGIAVPERCKLRASSAHPRQVGQLESTVPLPCVAAL